jgi:hypothetical protein
LRNTRTVNKLKFNINPPAVHETHSDAYNNTQNMPLIAEAMHQGAINGRSESFIEISLGRRTRNTGHFHSKTLRSNKEPESSKNRYSSTLAKELPVLRV